MEMDSPFSPCLEAKWLVHGGFHWLTPVQMMVDFAACKWPDGLKNGEDALARRFDNLNEPALSNLSSILEMDEDDTGTRPPVITFSHFLPLQASCVALPCHFHWQHIMTP